MLPIQLPASLMSLPGLSQMFQIAENPAVQSALMPEVLNAAGVKEDSPLFALMGGNNMLGQKFGGKVSNLMGRV